jgi:hypothetical protein
MEWLATSAELLELAQAELLLERARSEPLGSAALARTRSRVTRAMARVARARGRLLVQRSIALRAQIRARSVSPPPVSAVRLMTQ